MCIQNPCVNFIYYSRQVLECKETLRPSAKFQMFDVVPIKAVTNFEQKISFCLERL